MRKISFIEAAVEGYARQYDDVPNPATNGPSSARRQHSATRFLGAAVDPDASMRCKRRPERRRRSQGSAEPDLDPNVKTWKNFAAPSLRLRAITLGASGPQFGRTDDLGVGAESFPADQTFEALLAHAGGGPASRRTDRVLPGHVTPENAAAVAREKVTPVSAAKAAAAIRRYDYFAPVRHRSNPTVADAAKERKAPPHQMLPGLGATRSSPIRVKALADEPFADQRISTMLKKLDNKVGPNASYGPPGQSNKATLVFERDGVSTGASASARALAD